MVRNVVITGIGLVTPLGRDPADVYDRIVAGDSAAVPPAFDTTPFHCRLCAPVSDFNAEEWYPDNKTLRLMNRDAQMAVVAANLALRDASIRVDETYHGDEIALYGATGLTGLPVDDISRLVQYSAGEDGSLDLQRFGQVALKRVRPVMSFKILANIPICFVSIFEGIRGENAVFTPWEGQAARAIAAGIQAIRHGRADCALVGGCDVKTHEFSFISLQQLGLFDSWQRTGRGLVPGEGAAFLVIEEQQRAEERGARIYARVRGYGFQSTAFDRPPSDVFAAVLQGLHMNGDRPAIVAAADGNVAAAKAEQAAFSSMGIDSSQSLRPKTAMGDLFAAAASVQVALAAEMVRRSKATALANCFGFGSEQAAFLLEAR